MYFKAGEVNKLAEFLFYLSKSMKTDLINIHLYDKSYFSGGSFSC